MLKIDLPTLFAILGTAHGLFFSVLLWLRSKSRFSNKVFALLLLATSIRVAKNIVVHTSLIDPGLQYPINFWRTAVNGIQEAAITLSSLHHFRHSAGFDRFFVIQHYNNEDIC